MPLDFPASPTNGQLYPAAPNAQYIYNATAGGPSVGAWESLPMESAKTVTADVPPAEPKDGDQWFNTIDGTLYIYIVDVDGGQWVESQAPITANGYYSPNYLINGDFSVNQRNFFSVTGSGFGFDRWILGSNGGTVTYSAQSFTVGVAPVSGYEATNFARLAVSGQSSAGHYAQLVQRIEDVRTFAGQTATVSFWAKAASGTPKVLPSLYQSFGSGGSAGVANQDATVTLSTSWARYSVTIPVASISGKTVGANSYLQTALLVSGEGSAIGVQNNTFDFWGVQVESGSVATPFRRNANSIQGELAACQRYYEKSYSPEVVPGTSSTLNGQTVVAYSTLAGSTAGGIGFGGPISFKVTKRVVPTMVAYDFSGTANAVRVYPADVMRGGLTGFANMSVNGGFQFVTFDASSSTTITAGNSVAFNWTASAEL